LFVKYKMAFISSILWEKKSFKITNVQKKKKLENSTKISLTMSSESAKEQNDLNNQTDAKIPGKIKLSELEIAEREKNLRMLSEKWKKERISKEEIERKLFGFTKNSEILNGRMAMFFLTTGILTELWTKQSIVSQIDTMVRTLGLL